MKRLAFYLFFAVVTFTSLSFGSKSKNPINEMAAIEGSYYGYITIDGVFSDKHRAFVSKTIYYPGSGNCSAEWYRFEENAKASFAKYLKANYSDDFPYNVNNMIFRTGKTSSSASARDLHSGQQAQDGKNDWIADQKSDDNTVIQTVFSYSCE